MASKFTGYHGRNKPVTIVGGEYAGMVGEIVGQVYKRFKSEPDTFRVQIYGFPKSPGGWDGRITIGPEFLADNLHELVARYAEAKASLEEAIYAAYPIGCRCRRWDMPDGPECVVTCYCAEPGFVGVEPRKHSQESGVPAPLLIRIE